MTPIARTALAALVLATVIGGTVYMLRPTQQVAAPAVSPSLIVPASPEVVIPSGVVSRKSADQVAQMALEEIDYKERHFAELAGRGVVGATRFPLAPARIIRIQLMRAGETYPMRHFDPTSPEGAAMSGDGGVGWVIEAIGTDYTEHLDRSNVSGTILLDSKAVHRFFRFDDSSPDMSSILSFPCWTADASFRYPMDGNCP